MLEPFQSGMPVKFFMGQTLQGHRVHCRFSSLSSLELGSLLVVALNF